MNEQSLRRLQIIVERSVRPLLASQSRKRAIREELLAHVSEVFAEEAIRLNGDEAALARTAERFGPAAETTSQLQDSVPASDAIRRFWEGPPGESATRLAVRLAGVSMLAAVFLMVVICCLAPVRELSLDLLLIGLGAILVVPGYLAMLAFLTDWVARALNHPMGPSWHKVALLEALSWLFTVVWCVGLTWPSWPAVPDWPTATLLAIWLTVVSLSLPYVLAVSSASKARYRAEWAALDLS